jgi:formylglycine-generating enzyme required for sulfatase activity/protocatechuate 3,4-dioxygenase beta subunit
MFNPRSLRSAVIVATVSMLTAGGVWATENKRDESKAQSGAGQSKESIVTIAEDSAVSQASNHGNDHSAKPTDMGDGLKMEFVRIPAGSFYMGSPSSEKGRDDNEGPVHEVRISKPFYMGKYEVTQAQWKAVMGTTVRQQRDKADISWFLKSDTHWLLKGEGPEHPMYYVSWEEAVEFCKRLGRKFRLPTEAEWEYACRAGSQTRFYYGDDLDYSELDQYAWYDGNSNKTTHPVGKKKPNAWGLYDLHGSVSEWCSDWYAPVPNSYRNAGSVDPTGPASGFIYRVLRGGSWFSNARHCRSANRNVGSTPDGRSDLIGFRVVFTGDTDNDREVLEVTLPKETGELTIEHEQKPKIQTDDVLVITGVVRDEEGIPIDDLEMRILPIGSWFLRVLAKGRFEAFKSPRASDSEECYILARHVERNLATVMKIDENVNMLDVKLDPGAILTGKIVDSNCITIEGARVGTSIEGSNWRAIIPPVGMKSDAEGRFSFRALPLGQKYIFYASILHHRSNKIKFDSNDVPDKNIDLGSIVLARGKYSVSGIVVDAKGKPVPNVWVYCTGKGQAGINSHTDANGRFKADGIFKGPVHIIASLRKPDKLGYASGFTDTEAGATDVKIVLNRKGTLMPKGRACFPADTDVWVNGKVVQISRVGLGRTVGNLGCAVPTAAFGQIERLEEHVGTFECRDIVLQNGNCISVVDAHFFMLDSGRWIAAQDLRNGLRLKTLNGTVGIKSVTTRPTPFVDKVYNLKVKSSDQYMVGKDGVIVRDY